MRDIDLPATAPGCSADAAAGPSAPARSIDQRRAALARANEIRAWRAGLKRNLADRTTSLDDVVALLENPPDRILTMRIVELLIALPGVGAVKANRLLREAHVSPSKTVGGLSPRQRLAVVTWIEQRADATRSERAG